MLRLFQFFVLMLLCLIFSVTHVSNILAGRFFFKTLRASYSITTFFPLFMYIPGTVGLTLNLRP